MSKFALNVYTKTPGSHPVCKNFTQCKRRQFVRVIIFVDFTAQGLTLVPWGSRDIIGAYKEYRGSLFYSK